MKILAPFLQKIILGYYEASADRSYDWAGHLVAELSPKNILDIGCGDGSRLFNYFKKQPLRMTGIEANKSLAELASQKGIQIHSFDLNTKWPFPDNTFDAIHSSQVIEHIHHTRLFLAEAYRTLAPGGSIIMTSENLSSFLNLSAMILGYVPFSLQRVCGVYVGNPFGLHSQEDLTAEDLSHIDNPAFSGMFGHVRVLSASQARDLLRIAGFTNIEVSSIGLMPVPQPIGVFLEKFIKNRGHWLLMRATKPL